MKVSYFEKKNKKRGRENDDKKIKKIFLILIVVFSFTLISIALSVSEIIGKEYSQNVNSKDYVSVFNETDLKKILFYSHENGKEK